MNCFYKTANYLDRAKPRSEPFVGRLLFKGVSVSQGASIEIAQVRRRQPAIQIDSSGDEAVASAHMVLKQAVCNLPLCRLPLLPLVSQGSQAMMPLPALITVSER